MIEIPLTKGKTTFVDDDDHELVSAFKWHAWNANGKYWYAKGMKGLLLHRLIMHFPSGFVDHKNGNGLDNRKENLRLVSRAQNMMNSAVVIGTFSGFKGVHYEKHKKNPWRARIKVNGKFLSLGSFATSEAAAFAFDEAARQYQGEFASLNFPRDGERGARAISQEAPPG